MSSGEARSSVEGAQWQPPESWKPAPTAIDVWRVDWVTRSPGVAEERIDAWAERLLSPAESTRASRLVVSEKRRQFRRSRAALRVLLGQRLAVDPRNVGLRIGDHGRPEADGVVFNLSHSGTVAVVVLGSDRTIRLGVDVERVEVERPVDRLVERFFAPAEIAAFARCPPAERAVEFARRWALKEAYVKALGTGLTYSSRDFSLRDDPVSWRARPLLDTCARHGDAHRSWSFRNLWLELGGDRFAMALCSDDEATARTFRFDFPGQRG